MKFSRYKIILILGLLFILASRAFAQTTGEKAIELFKQGKNNKEALAALEKASKEVKKDADVWNYLGLAYVRNEELKKAVKAFEKAVGLSPQNAVYRTNLAYAYFSMGKMNKAQAETTKAIAIDPRYALAYYIRGAASIREGDISEAISDADRAIAVNPNYAGAYTLKSDALFAKFGSNEKPTDSMNVLQAAKDVLELCLKNCTDNKQADLQRERLEALTVFYDYFDKNRDRILARIMEPPSKKSKKMPAETPPPVPPQPVDPSITPLKILTKPRAEYTDTARRNGTQGVITIVVLFAGSGRITQALVLRGLDSGLNENALKAARQITFEPAKKDGKPISQVKIIEYSFAIY